jgi:hypothetical protein
MQCHAVQGIQCDAMQTVSVLERPNFASSVLMVAVE